MTAALVSITLRALVNRRRTLMLGLLGALLVLIAFLGQLGGGSEETSRDVVLTLLGDFGLGVLVPVVAVIVGTSVIGAELDDGTIVYLLAKPVPRWLIVLVKFVVAWLTTVVLTAPAVLVAGIVANADTQVAVAFTAATVVAALEYTAIFVALSLITSRALIIGLAYVVIWEGVIAGLFSGTRFISVRQHALAVVEWLGGSTAEGSTDLALVTALLVGVLVLVTAIAIAVVRLGTVELRGESG
ncbi:MAG: ABC transporter permease [Chloroflexota bacterium]|nr:ABC transporter permease [Chloroflexota bacterium]